MKSAFILAILAWSYNSMVSDAAINYTMPITPTDYQKVIKQGFSTNYFKTTRTLKKYREQNLKDVQAKGFSNLRLRCRTDLDGFDMDTFLTNLETVVDDCLKNGISPVISWVNHYAEAYGTDAQRTDYLNWWESVATKLKDKDYRVSFNLFTELGVDTCKPNCEGSLRQNTTKYNDWTRNVVTKIRNAGGNSKERIIILGSPKKTARGLDQIDEDIYENDSYMLAEWHIYASGPNQINLTNSGKPSQKYWKDDGNVIGKDKVDAAFKYATDFTESSGLQTYLGAWMPQDMDYGDLSQYEVEKFAEYFVQQIKPIPWSMNVLDRYYNTKKSEWLTSIQDISGVSLNMSKVLDVIKENM